MEKYQPDEHDKITYLLQFAHVDEGDYFSSRVHKDIDAIMDGLRKAHKGRIDSAPVNSVAEELKKDLEEAANFEGSQFETKPELLLAKSVDNATSNALTIKDPFTFEFPGLDAKEAVTESDLEQALMDHLQEFMLESGQGFCFEAKQKRIIIDDKYYFIDLIFYNRLLHCNVIIKLKNDEFKHEDLGQLNAYVGYYKKNEMMPGDNPPVGILLCTDKGSQMVEYALSGMDNQLFVSTYMLHLPDKRKLEEFMLKELKEMGM